jgi:Sulfotransferase family
LRNGPIFIVGAPRSGTTLLRNTLNRHPRIAVCRETEFRHYVYRRRAAFGPLSDRGNRERVIRAYLALERIRRTSLDLEELARCLMEEGDTYPALFSSLLRFYMRAHGKQRWGEKTPDHALFARTLLDWYPGATVIHILRDPRDAVASLIDMPSFPNSALGNANLWLTFNRAAMEAQQEPGYVVVRYENLVADPETELRRLCRIIGEPFSDEMTTPKPDPTADRPWFQRAEGPIANSRVGMWRERLSKRDLALVEWFLGYQMQAFGYEPASKRPSPAAIAGGFLFGVKDAVQRRLGEFPAIWYRRASSTQLAREEAAATRYHNRVLQLSTREW